MCSLDRVPMQDGVYGKCGNITTHIFTYVFESQPENLTKKQLLQCKKDLSKAKLYAGFAVAILSLGEDFGGNVIVSQLKFCRAV